MAARMETVHHRYLCLELWLGNLGVVIVTAVILAAKPHMLVPKNRSRGAI